jgi:hypothetical protein
MSKFHFVRVFEEMTSVSPARFLASLRLERAKHLLLETSLPVTTVALEVGYNSLTTFTRLFTEFVGASPMSFRARYLELADGSIPDLAARGRRGADTALPARRLAVSVRAPSHFSGLVFLGLFSSAIPRGLPIAGSLLGGPGAAELAIDRPFRNGFLLAAGFRPDASMKSYFLPAADSILLGSLAVMVGETCMASTDEFSVTLRPPLLFDPPILIALPLLLIGSEQSGAGRMAG